MDGGANLPTTTTCRREDVADAHACHTFEDMDIFYYKQIATHMQDFELQKKIEHELKMCDGATKLLAAVRHASLTLEAAKTLITSNIRMTAYVEALRQKKTLAANAQCNNELPVGNQYPSKAKVALSDIRVPLMWKDTDHFKNKGNHRRFAMFCVAKIGTEVQDTSLVSEIDRTVTDVTFEDCLILSDVSHNFSCSLDVYAYELSDDLSIASVPLKFRKRINDISNNVGRRLSGFSLREPPDDNAPREAKFEVVARANFSLEDCRESVCTHNLVQVKESVVAAGLPLFGNFCCRIVAQPYSLTKETVSSNLLVQDAGGWCRRWCVLQSRCISCWPTAFEADLQPPVLTVPVTKDFLVMDADPSRADRPFMFHVRSLHQPSKQYSLAAETAADLTLWWDGFHQHLLDQVVWSHACETLMPIKSMPSTKHFPAYQRSRAHSLYEKTTVKGAHLMSCHIASDSSQLTPAISRLTGDRHRKVERKGSFCKMSL